MSNFNFNSDADMDLGPCLFLSATGLVTNILNVITFWKMGFRETSNISLMALSVNDCVKCCAGLLYRCYGLIGHFDLVLEVNWTIIFFTVDAHVHNFGTLLANVTVMYLTIERWVCLLLPLRVKSMLTPKVASVALVSLIGAMLTSLSPVFGKYYITWVFEPRLNSSLVQYATTELFIDNQSLMYVLFVIHLFWSFAPFLVTAITTGMIIVLLNRHVKIRIALFSRSKEGATATHNNYQPRQSNSKKYNPVQPTDTMSIKEARIVIMLLLIALLYFVHILPRLAIVIVTFFQPKFYFVGEFSDIYMTCVAVTLIIDLLVANVHLVIYLLMSSQFRSVFFRTFVIKHR